MSAGHGHEPPEPGHADGDRQADCREQDEELVA